VRRGRPSARCSIGEIAGCWMLLVALAKTSSLEDLADAAAA
jgi:hypothetical protein